MSQQVNQQQQVKSTADVVKVRVIRGRVLLARSSEDSDEDVFAEPGQVVEMRRKDYERLSKRSFDSYHTGTDAENQMPSTTVDCPVELVS